MRSLNLCCLLLAALAAPLNAQQCCFPLVWQGGHTIYVPSTNFYTRSRVSVDLKSKRMASVSLITHDRRSFHVKAIVNWAAKKQYLIYKIRNRLVCRVTNIKKSLPRKPNCLPAGFRKLISYRIGAGKESLRQNAYGLFTRNYDNVISVTDSCVPVRDSVLFRKPNSLRQRGTYASASWYNIRPGIRNRAVFRVPKQCLQPRKFAAFEHVRAMEAPEHMYGESVDSFLNNMNNFEKTQHEPEMMQLQHQIPSGAMHTVQASMDNLVSHTLDQAKRIEGASGKKVEDLFMKL